MQDPPMKTPRVRRSYGMATIGTIGSVTVVDDASLLRQFLTVQSPISQTFYTTGALT